MSSQSNLVKKTPSLRAEARGEGWGVEDQEACPWSSLPRAAAVTSVCRSSLTLGRSLLRIASDISVERPSREERAVTN